MQICSGSCDILCVAANNAVLLRNYANAGRAIRSAQHVEGLRGAARPEALSEREITSSRLASAMLSPSEQVTEITEIASYRVGLLSTSPISSALIPDISLHLLFAENSIYFDLSALPNYATIHHHLKTRKSFSSSKSTPRSPCCQQLFLSFSLNARLIVLNTRITHRRLRCLDEYPHMATLSSTCWHFDI